MKYLLDTNICIYFLNGQFNLQEKIEQIKFENCCISEITLAELKYGIAKSTRKEENKKIIQAFQSKIEIIPIFSALDIFAEEKARLKTKGKTVDEFDLLIGSTAVFNNYVLVTRNVKDFEHIKNIKIEDWTK